MCKHWINLKYCAEIYVVRLGDHFLCIITVNHWSIMKAIIHIFLMWHNFSPKLPVRLCCYCLKNLNFRFMEFCLINFELCHIFQQKTQFVWPTKIVSHVTITSGDVLGVPNLKWRITKDKFVVCFICLHFVKMFLSL